MNSSTLFKLKAPPTIAGFAKSHAVTYNYTEISDNSRTALRKTIEDWNVVPSAKKASIDLINTIKSEERKNSQIKSSDIKVNDDCSLSFGEETFPITSLGFKGIVRCVAPSGALNFLSNVDPELRAYNLRYLFNKTDKTLNLRTRNGIDGREIYSVVSGKYPDVQATDVLELISKKTSEDSKAIWTYNPNTTGLSFREVFQKDIDVYGYKHDKNEVFRIGQDWFLRDDGATSISLSLMTFRQLCANMVLLSPDILKYKKVRHRGDREGVVKRIDSLYAKASSFSHIFRDQWASSRKVTFHANPTVDTVSVVYGYLLNKKKLSSLGMDKDLLAASLAVNWEAEGGNTVADLVNGVTRYARNIPSSNSRVFSAQKLEEDAGNLLFAPSVTWEKTKRLSA